MNLIKIQQFACKKTISKCRLQNGPHFANDIFKFTFFNEKVCILIQISLTSVPKGRIDITQSSVEVCNEKHMCMSSLIMIFARSVCTLQLRSTDRVKTGVKEPIQIGFIFYNTLTKQIQTLNLLKTTSKVGDLSSRIAMTDYCFDAFAQVRAIGLLTDTRNCGCACAGNAGNVFPVTASERSRHASRHVRHACAVMHAGITN